MSRKNKIAIFLMVALFIVLFVIPVSYYLFLDYVFNGGLRVRDYIDDSSEIWVCRNEDFTFTMYNQNTIPDEYRSYLFDMGDACEELSGTLTVYGDTDYFGILDMKDSSCNFAVCWESGRAAEFFLYNCKIIEEAENIENFSSKYSIIEQYRSHFNVKLSFDKKEMRWLLDEECSGDPDIKSLNVSELVFKREEPEKTN